MDPRLTALELPALGDSRWGRQWFQTGWVVNGTYSVGGGHA